MKVDPKLVPLSAYLGVAGMPGATAWIGLLEHCQPKAGETVQQFDVALYHHALGSAPTEDPVVFGAGYASIAEYRFPDGPAWTAANS
jgi:hypothetical protein